jgi:hypothetical protein
MIEIKPKNAALPVKYTWNTGDTTSKMANLETGAYSVQMIDANGCGTDTNIFVDLYPALTHEVLKSPEICSGENGNISFRVHSAMPHTLTYLWEGGSNTIPRTGLKAGTYYVTISDTLCSIKDTIVIETIDGLVVDFEIQSYDTCTRTATFVEQVKVQNGKKSDIEWTIYGTNVSSYDSIFTYTFPDPDTPTVYAVRLTAYAANRCVDTSRSSSVSLQYIPLPELR